MHIGSEVFNDNQVEVPIYYLNRTVCCSGGPFRDLLRLQVRVASFINPDELVKLLSVPLHFSSRRFIMWSVLPFVLLILFIVGIPTYITEVAPQSQVATRVVEGLLLAALIVGYVTLVLYLRVKFEQ